MKKKSFMSRLENTLTPPVLRFGPEKDRRQDYIDDLPSYAGGSSTGIGWDILEFFLELIFDFFT